MATLADILLLITEVLSLHRCEYMFMVLILISFAKTVLFETLLLSTEVLSLHRLWDHHASTAPLRSSQCAPAATMPSATVYCAQK
jgi:hypothetical protein